MSRMHSRKRGSSGSTRPRTVDAGWVDQDEEEVEELVEKLAEQDLQPAQIGAVLRDRYGIPSVRAVTGKTITQILEEREAGLGVPEDLYNLMQRALQIREHLEEHEKDLEAKRNLSLTESKIRRLGKYYRGTALPEDWKYSPEQARLMVR